MLATQCAEGIYSTTSNTYPTTAWESLDLPFTPAASRHYTLPAGQRFEHPQDVIFNESPCSIITNETRTSPELHGETQKNTGSSQFYVSDQLCIVADHEIPLKSETSPEVARLNEVQNFDNNSLPQIR